MTTANEPASTMTKREILAMAAMEGMLSSIGPDDSYPNPDSLARRSYNYADAMLNQPSTAELVEALEKIASCESKFPGDVVDIAKQALARVK